MAPLRTGCREIATRALLMCAPCKIAQRDSYQQPEIHANPKANMPNAACKVSDFRPSRPLSSHGKHFFRGITNDRSSTSA